MTSANQDPNLKGSFKFGRGQFFPMILLLVRNGRRVEEYTGVINEVRTYDIDIKSFLFKWFIMRIGVHVHRGR